MKFYLNEIEWKAKSEIMDRLLEQPELIKQEIEQGFEAEVVKFSAEQGSFVLKIWNKSSNPNVELQYRLLGALYEQGVSVSRPLGWGMNKEAKKVLLTAYDGDPVRKVNKEKVKQMAAVLSGIHQVNIGKMASVGLPSYDFISYFFPRSGNFAELSTVLAGLVEKFPVKRNGLIHGDFHLSNLVEQENRMTVIDWTNGQLGDARYDLAWTLILLKLYVSERHAGSFLEFYLKKNPISPEEFEAFEAMAIIRWILLARSGGAPSAPEFLRRMDLIVKSNNHLKELNWSDIQ